MDIEILWMGLGMILSIISIKNIFTKKSRDKLMFYWILLGIGVIMIFYSTKKWWNL